MNDPLKIPPLRIPDALREELRRVARQVVEEARQDFDPIIEEALEREKPPFVVSEDGGIIFNFAPRYYPYNKDEMKNEQIVHVCMGDDKNFYFGSVAAIFDTFTPDELGVSLSGLWAYGLAPDRPYKNDHCAIYRDTIHRKKQSKI